MKRKKPNKISRELDILKAGMAENAAKLAKLALELKVLRAEDKLLFDKILHEISKLANKIGKRKRT